MPYFSSVKSKSGKQPKKDQHKEMKYLKLNYSNEHSDDKTKFLSLLLK